MKKSLQILSICLLSTFVYANVWACGSGSNAANKLAIETALKNYHDLKDSDRSDSIESRASQGDHEAQVKYAMMLRNELNYTQALRQLRKAVEAQYLPAYLPYGDMLEKGLGLGRRDIPGALEVYEAAAEVGESEATVRMGVIYRDGIDVVTDYGKATQLFQTAINAGYVKAYRFLGEYYEFGPSKDYGRAQDMYEAGANRGDDDALVNLATMHWSGHGFTWDVKAAERMLVAPALRWNMRAIYLLYVINEYDYKGTPALRANNPNFRRMLSAAADSGSPYAQYISAALLRYGPAKTKLMTLAADQGFVSAYYDLANYYLWGNGVKKDVFKAIELFTKSADLGHARSCIELGQIYEDGKTGIVDKAKAIEWYQRGVALGNSTAVDRLRGLTGQNNDFAAFAAKVVISEVAKALINSLLPF